MGERLALANKFLDLKNVASGSPFPPRLTHTKRRRRRRQDRHLEPRLLISILLVSSFCLFRQSVSFSLTRGITDHLTTVSFLPPSSTSSSTATTTTAASRYLPRRLDKSTIHKRSLAVGPLTAMSTSSSPDTPWTTSSTTPTTSTVVGTADNYHQWKVGKCIGSGSYGTVHYLEATGAMTRDTLSSDSAPTSQSQIQRQEWFVGKRAWKDTELDNNPQRQARCQYYWQVEAHCFAKLPRHPQLPPYYGTTAILYNDPSQNQRPQRDEWMVFGPILSPSLNEDEDNEDAATTPLYDPSCPPPLAKSLAQYMELDWQHGISIATTTKSTKSTIDDVIEQQQQRLPHLSKALGCSNDASTLDTLFSSLLSALVHIHDSQIVHRDLKPSNILIAEGGNPQQQEQEPNVVLIDFGSAADLEPLPSASFLPFSNAKRYMGLDVNEQRVSVSPLYCAPETFIDPQNSPLAFDLSSCGLILCQFLFGFLEERSDAGFRQQLLVDTWDLNRWLANQLASKVRPEGLEDALAYLGDRPGLWTLLQALLEKEPKDRPTAKEAQGRLTAILEGAKLFQTAHNDDDDTKDGPDRLTLLEREDGPFFAMVVESIEACQLPTVSRPLHFVATFSRKKPLGLVFSEIGGEDDDNEKTVSDDPANQLLIQATKDAVPGEVFIKDIVPGGQADKLGIFEIGDRLQGVGELTFTAAGFEKAVEMLQDQPKSAQNVRLHFDRLRVRDNAAIPILPPSDTKIAIVDQGLWSSKGRRQTQEDAFVLHEIHATKDRSVLLMGVMDGHGGTAASRKVAQELPLELTNQIVVNRRPLESSLKDAWETVCQSYQLDCQDQGECVADYDNRQGALDANTGSIDLIAGTTASVIALDETNGELVTLNCGDSRSIVVTPDGLIQLATRDHTPQSEAERLQQGVASGLDYSLPTCKISKWTILAGKYEYSVGRSLEGPFVRSKGIVSDADITCTYVGVGEILLCATDGLWEVMDSEEIAMDIAMMRKQGMNARDCARAVCSMALDKGTTDNVSAVIVYL